MNIYSNEMKTKTKKKYLVNLRQEENEKNANQAIRRKYSPKVSWLRQSFL